jgi:hypothetical protein
MRCTIEGCEAEAVAKRLCTKHYTRARRTGDPTKVRKRGAPRNELLAMLRDTLPHHWSRRTVARFHQAMSLLVTQEERKELIRACTRPNGSLNVWQMLQIAKLRHRAISNQDVNVTNGTSGAGDSVRPRAI